MRICQVGPWPPPYGGVSVYVQRLARQLQLRGHEVLLLDTSEHHVDDPGGLRVRPLPFGRDQALRLAEAAAAHGADVAHVHLVGLPWKTVLPFALACEAVGVALVISVHSFRDYDPVAPRAQRALHRACGRLISHAFASGHHVARRLTEVGLPPAKVTEVAPFVPPTRATPADARLPAPLRDFLAAHDPVISAGAGHLKRNEADQDLYGFDAFVDLALGVQAAYPDAGFVFQLPRRGDDALYARAMAAAAPLGERLLVHATPLEEAADLWAVSDLFVRPTRNDGDSVSVREALSLGVPTLASDAVARPAGVSTYRVGDHADAARAACALLGDLPAARAAVDALVMPPAVAAVERALVQAGARARWQRRTRSLRGRALHRGRRLALSRLTAAPHGTST